MSPLFPKGSRGVFYFSRSPYHSFREPLIQSLSEIILEILCKTRKGNPRLVNYLRIFLTKYCTKFRMISDSSIESVFPIYMRGDLLF